MKDKGQNEGQKDQNEGQKGHIWKIKGPQGEQKGKI